MVMASGIGDSICAASYSLLMVLSRITAKPAVGIERVVEGGHRLLPGGVVAFRICNRCARCPAPEMEAYRALSGRAGLRVCIQRHSNKHELLKIWAVGRRQVAAAASLRQP